MPLRVQRVHHCWRLNDVLLPSPLLAHPTLAERVQAPGEDLALLVDGKGMVRARADKDNVPEGEPFGRESVELPALDDPSAELVLLAVAPDVDGAVDGEGDDVVGTAGDGGEAEMRDGRERDGGELVLGRARFAVKAKETLGRLGGRRGEGERLIS
jgi:hypothetical protein